MGIEGDNVGGEASPSGLKLPSELRDDVPPLGSRRRHDAGGEGALNCVRGPEGFRFRTSSFVLLRAGGLFVQP